MSKKIGMTGRSKTPPRSGVRQGPWNRADAAVVTRATQESALHSPQPEVYSGESPIVNPVLGGRKMELVLNTKQPAKSNAAVYSIPGLRGTIRFAKALFVNGAPTSILVEGDFTTPKAPKVKMTAEERKAARAAQPRLTEQEKVERAEAALARRKAKLAAFHSV